MGFYLGNGYDEIAAVYILSLIGSTDVYKLLKHHIPDLEIITEAFFSFLCQIWSIEKKYAPC